MIIIYVLVSLKDNSTYVGMSKNIDRRLNEHNLGKSRYTKGHIPWKLVYTESRQNWLEARQKEKFFKSTQGKNWLKENGFLN